ncbi:hypothetical protein CHUAL_012865 [Chamberlinius hualienensis]
MKFLNFLRIDGNLLLVLANIVVFCSAVIFIDQQEQEDSNLQLNNFDVFYQDLIKASRLQSQTFKPNKDSEIASVQLEWRSCGREDDIISFQNVILNPNPFQFPGHLQFGFDMVVTQNITDTIKLDIDMKKEMKIFGISTWVPVPCYHHIVGSCDIRDICNLKNFTWCPMQINGKNASCQCPIIQGNYKFPSMNMELPHIPSVINPSLVEGVYKPGFSRPVATLELRPYRKIAIGSNAEQLLN